jgi:hypothetical protein
MSKLRFRFKTNRVEWIRETEMFWDSSACAEAFA